MDTIETINKEIKPLEREINFDIGDTVRVHYRIIEGTRERIQVFEGIAISINNDGNSITFTVRKISFDIGVERIFLLFSPRIAKIEVVRKGKAKRAKLYYLRQRKGKSAKLREKRGKSAKEKNNVQSQIKDESIEEENKETVSEDK